MKWRDILQKYGIPFLLIATISFSLFLLFYRFWDQWDIFGDAGRDQIVGYVAYKEHRLPLTGSFSSAGPFVFGPIYYWFLAVSYVFFPLIPDSPQLFFRLVHFATLYAFWKIGYFIGKKRLATILFLLAAVSPARLFGAINLTHHALVGSVATFLILFLTYYQKAKRDDPEKESLHLAFLLGFTFGVGWNIHFLSVNLWPLFLVYLAVNRFRLTKIWRECTMIILGFWLPNLAYFYWDATYGWANLRNFFDNILIASERRYVPNSWWLYAGQFWPGLWSFYVGDHRIFGYILLCLTGCFLLLGVVKKMSQRIMLYYGLVFLLLFVILRYYRGEAFYGYFVFFTPFILLFSAWVIERIIVYKNWIGLLILVIILFFDLRKDIQLVHEDVTNSHIREVQQAVDTLIDVYPNSLFRPYIRGSDAENLGYGIVILLERQGKIGIDGIPIGLCQTKCSPEFPLLVRTTLGDNLQIVDLKPQDHKLLLTPEKSGWKLFTPHVIYNDVVEWWKEEPLTSTFSLSKYMLGKIGR